MCYRCDGCAAYSRDRRFVFIRYVAAHHFAAWNDVMTAILKSWRHIGNQTRQSFRIYLMNNLAKLHSCPILNDAPNNKKNKKNNKK